jgi:hypothetical protein
LEKTKLCTSPCILHKLWTSFTFQFIQTCPAPQVSSVKTVMETFLYLINSASYNIIMLVKTIMQNVFIQDYHVCLLSTLNPVGNISRFLVFQSLNFLWWWSLTGQNAQLEPTKMKIILKATSLWSC